MIKRAGLIAVAISLARCGWAGNYSLVDHSIFRLSKGAAGVLRVEGKDAPEIYKAVK